MMKWLIIVCLVVSTIVIAQHRPHELFGNDGQLIVPSRMERWSREYSFAELDRVSPTEPSNLASLISRSTSQIRQILDRPMPANATTASKEAWIAKRDGEIDQILDGLAGRSVRGTVVVEDVLNLREPPAPEVHEREPRKSEMLMALSEWNRAKALAITRLPGDDDLSPADRRRIAIAKANAEERRRMVRSRSVGPAYNSADTRTKELELIDAELQRELKMIRQRSDRRDLDPIIYLLGQPEIFEHVQTESPFKTTGLIKRIVVVRPSPGLNQNGPSRIAISMVIALREIGASTRPSSTSAPSDGDP